MVADMEVDMVADMNYSGLRYTYIQSHPNITMLHPALITLSIIIDTLSLPLSLSCHIRGNQGHVGRRHIQLQPNFETR